MPFSLAPLQFPTRRTQRELDVYTHHVRRA